MTISSFKAGKLLVMVSLVALLAGCAVSPEPFTPDELAQKAKLDRADMFKGGEPLKGPLTLSEALARALKYNLDSRAKMMDEALALGQTEVDRWDLLPKVVANAGYNGRSKANASRSRDLYTQATSTSNPTYSADRDAITADLGLSWNVLDFGISYFNAHENADRALIATERRRKAIHTLATDVRFAFWRAATHQELRDDVARAVTEAKMALERSRDVERENLKAPVDSLRYQKSLLETMRQLTHIEQELSTARFELASLINLPPGSDMVLSVPETLNIPVWNIPTERMEEQAFLDNADLREQGYQARIAVNETRKAILKLFPGITFSGSGNYDHNSFLVHNQWYEAGAKLSWNLMNLASGYDSISFANTNEEVVKARRLALRMTVLAQVHVAEQQYRNAINQFNQSDDLWKVDRRLLELAEAKSANNAQGILEKVANQASAIASQLRRYQNFSMVEQAYSRMQATMGQDLLPAAIASHDLDSLTAVVAERLQAGDKVAGEPRDIAVREENAPAALEEVVPHPAIPEGGEDAARASQSQESDDGLISNFSKWLSQAKSAVGEVLAGRAQ